MAWLTDEAKRLQLSGARKKPVVQATRAPPDPTSIDGHSLDQLLELLRKNYKKTHHQYVAGRGQKEGRGWAGPDRTRPESHTGTEMIPGIADAVGDNRGTLGRIPGRVSVPFKIHQNTYNSSTDLGTTVVDAYNPDK